MRSSVHSSTAPIRRERASSVLRRVHAVPVSLGSTQIDSALHRSSINSVHPTPPVESTFAASRDGLRSGEGLILLGAKCSGKTEFVLSVAAKHILDGGQVIYITAPPRGKPFPVDRFLDILQAEQEKRQSLVLPGTFNPFSELNGRPPNINQHEPASSSMSTLPFDALDRLTVVSPDTIDGFFQILADGAKILTREEYTENSPFEVERRRGEGYSGCPPEDDEQQTRGGSTVGSELLHPFCRLQSNCPLSSSSSSLHSIIGGALGSTNRAQHHHHSFGEAALSLHSKSTTTTTPVKLLILDDLCGSTVDERPNQRSFPLTSSSCPFSTFDRVQHLLPTFLKTIPTTTTDSTPRLDEANSSSKQQRSSDFSPHRFLSVCSDILRSPCGCAMLISETILTSSEVWKRMSAAGRNTPLGNGCPQDIQVDGAEVCAHIDHCVRASFALSAFLSKPQSLTSVGVQSSARFPRRTSSSLLSSIDPSSSSSSFQTFGLNNSSSMWNVAVVSSIPQQLPSMPSTAELTYYPMHCLWMLLTKSAFMQKPLEASSDTQLLTTSSSPSTAYVSASQMGRITKGGFVFL